MSSADSPEVQGEMPREPAASLSRETVDLLKAQFGEAIRSVRYFRDETTIEVDPGRVLDVCRLLRDHDRLRYNLLADVCGLDRLYLDAEGPRFAVVYNLYSIPFRRRIRLKACVDGEPPTVPSVTPLWSSANWHEREAYDLVGIRFQGHPNLERILTPEGFEGHPHRKDFDAGDEPVQFTGGQQYLRHHHETTTEDYLETARKTREDARHG